MTTYLHDAIMRPCLRCGTPYEAGEDVCVTCAAPLATGWAGGQGRRGLPARRRAQRANGVITGVILLIGGLGAPLAFSLVLDEWGMSPWRDEQKLFVFGAFAIAVILNGYPGRTLQHYPFPALIRRGIPRWIKDLAGIILAAGAAAAINELIVRATLTSRRAALIADGTYSAPQLDGVVETAMTIAYSGVAIYLAWVIVGSMVLGPQLLADGRRKKLAGAATA